MKTTRITGLLFAIVLGWILQPAASWGKFNEMVYELCSEGCGINYQSCSGGCTDSACSQNCWSVYRGCMTYCGGLASGNVNDTATVSDNGHDILVTGPITCAEGLKIQSLDVTVTQRGVGAIAHGHTHGRCMGVEQEFSVNAKVRGQVEFLVPGVAEVCATAQIGVGTLRTDSIQWCNEDVLLVPEE